MSTEDESIDLIADIDANIGANMKVRREQMGLSQAEMAELAKDAGIKGIHQTTIARIEKGERALRAAEAIAMSRILDTSIEYLAESGATANARSMNRSLSEKSTELYQLLKHVTYRRIEVARFLDRLVPVGEEETPLLEMVGMQLKTNIEPRLLDMLDETLMNADPEDRLAWLYSSLRHERKKAFEEGHNVPEPGYRESKIYQAMQEYMEDDGEHQTEA